MDLATGAVPFRLDSDQSGESQDLQETFQVNSLQEVVDQTEKKSI